MTLWLLFGLIMLGVLNCGDCKQENKQTKKRELTRCIFGVVHLPVVGADALVQPRVRRRAAVAQRARAAAHRRVRGVEVLRTLEALVIVPIGVQPAVAVLSLSVRYPQVPGQVSQQQAAQEVHHPAQPKLPPHPPHPGMPGSSPRAEFLQLPDTDLKVSAAHPLGHLSRVPDPRTL